MNPPLKDESYSFLIEFSSMIDYDGSNDYPEPSLFNGY